MSTEAHTLSSVKNLGIRRAPKLMALAACMMGVISIASAGILTSGSSEDFLASEFNGGSYAVNDTFTVTHTLTFPSSGDYGVWDFSNAYVENSDQSIRPWKSVTRNVAEIDGSVPRRVSLPFVVLPRNTKGRSTAWNRENLAGQVSI